jgi:hypothetical protein
VRLQYSLVHVLILVVILSCSLGATVYLIHRRHYSKAAEHELAELCRKAGGSLNIDLVDGDIYVDLHNSTLRASEMKKMPELFLQCISSDLGEAGRVHVDLSNAKIDCSVLEAVNARVVGLSVAGLEVDDNMLQEIVAKCPCLEELNLDNTQITDKAVPAIASLPIRSLSIRNTNMSVGALYQLAACEYLYRLVVTLSDSDVLLLCKEMPYCDIGQ